jgi:hypothetical protein
VSFGLLPLVSVSFSVLAFSGKLSQLPSDSFAAHMRLTGNLHEDSVSVIEVRSQMLIPKASSPGVWYCQSETPSQYSAASF